ncbi:MAG: metal ABC transporter permease [Erysipelotrichaceae bacterium]|nr:metal ABC transporter permease [Erysipelotrichaceae bacterium]
MLSELFLYLSFPFVRYALIVSVLIALCSSLLGVILVLRRFSHLGDGLSHVAFGAMAAASVVGLKNDMAIVLPVTVATAVFLLKNGKRGMIKGDAAIAMLSTAALAFGYLMMNLFPTSGNISGDVCTTLFGSTSILTLKRSDVILCSVLSFAVLLIYILFYEKIFAITFDEDFAKATGVDTARYNLLIAIVIAVVVVLAMNLVGSLLISALLVFPVLSAMRLFASFRNVSVFAALISVICAVTGILISILASTPVGSTIVACDFIIFLLCTLFGRNK